MSAWPEDGITPSSVADLRACEDRVEAEVFMATPSRWPMGTALLLKRVTDLRAGRPVGIQKIESGYLLKRPDGSVEPVVRATGDPLHWWEYPSFEAVAADGWKCD